MDFLIDSHRCHGIHSYLFVSIQIINATLGVIEGCLDQGGPWTCLWNAVLTPFIEMEDPPQPPMGGVIL